VFEVRPSSNADEFARSIYGIAQYFGAPLDEERIERFKQVLPFERMHAAFEDGEIVGGVVRSHSSSRCQAACSRAAARPSLACIQRIAAAASCAG